MIKQKNKLMNRNKREETIMIFYFTATGNCLHVARQFEENPISIPQVINQENLVFKDETIGIVWPIYAGEPPKMVLDFLKKSTFQTDYLYMILTYGKNDSDAPEYVDHLCQSFGMKINYIKTILMVDNYLPSFDMDEEKAINKHVDQQIQVALADIKARKNEIPEASQESRDFHARAAKIFADNPALINGEQITVTDQCIGCGICTKVCPIANFYIMNKIAKRHSEVCEFCLACAHHCPQKAIITKVSDKNPKARYRNEHVTLQDIIRSNQQDEYN